MWLTKLTSASPRTNSLRTTVPVHIIKLLELTKGDHLNWGIEPDGDGWKITVEPITFMKVVE
jgi:hypothetical protein